MPARNLVDLPYITTRVSDRSMENSERAGPAATRVATTGDHLSLVRSTKGLENERPFCFHRGPAKMRRCCSSLARHIYARDLEDIIYLYESIKYVMHNNNVL